MMKIIFIILSLLTGFFLGVLYGSLTLPPGSGLAAGAIVLGYGVIGAFIALVLSIFLSLKIEKKLLRKINILLLILNLIPVGWVIYRAVILPSEAPERLTPKPVTPTAEPVSLVYQQNNERAEMGLGLVKPDFFNKKNFYFYSTPNLEKAISEHMPSDSLVFIQNEFHYDISYAPPWFYPEHLKLDYEILYLKILTLHRDWIQVEVNKQTGISLWISSPDAEVLLWPEFLLTVFSVEILDPVNNLLRIKPLTHASPLTVQGYSFLTPVMIKDNWLKVNLVDNNFNKIGEAWLQWCKEGSLLISYSLLS